MSNSTKSELVKQIIELNEELENGLNASGFDWQGAAAKLGAANNELAQRFNLGVGYGGVTYQMIRE